MNQECGHAALPGMAGLEILRAIAAGADPFTGCHASGDFGKCLQTLAELRRGGLIDRSRQLTEAGRAVLAACRA
jgi:hypothetical protein